MRLPSSTSTYTRILCVFACLLSFNNNNNIQFANAQGQPQPCGGAAYKVVDNKFYIHGGALQGDQLLQSLWALDLTTNWTTSTPAWIALPLGPYNAYHSGGRSADNKTFIVFGRDTSANSNVVPNSFVNIFDISSKTWKELNPQGINDTSRRDFDVVTNPSANKVYILGGDAGPSGSTYSNMFSTYDVATQTVTEVTTPAPGPQDISTYNAVWSPKLNAMVVVAGNYKSGAAAQGLLLYHPDTGAWTTQTTNGPFNYGRSSACAATNGDGSLIVVFGGFIGGSGQGDPNIYVLNTATWLWTATKYPGQGRGNAACAIVDDTFMVWGGFLASPNTINGVPTGADALLLYSLSKSQWQTTYTPSAAMTGGGQNSTGYPGGPTPTNGDSPDGNGGNNNQNDLSSGALAGIIAGSVAALAIAIFGIVSWHRRRKHSLSGKDTSYETAGINSIEEHQRGSGPSATRPPPPGLNTITGQYQSLKAADEANFDPRLSVDGSYGSGGGYSNATTPTTLDFLHTNEHRSERGRQSYQSDGSVYYPPPPAPISHQPTIPEDSPYMSEHSVSGSGRRFNDPQSLPLDNSGVANYQYAGLTGLSTAASVGPAYAATGSDYHDGGYYADRDREKYQSGISTQTGYSRVSSVGSDPQAIIYPNTSPPMPKRVVSGPQGGEGFGFVIEPSPPGAPQALLEYQRSIPRQQEKLQPQPLQYHQPLPQSPPPLAPRPSNQSPY
ncbi:hypothetical protein EC957_012214 [Mortierella hygrophila]|uniref:Attractin/MKLN-like beta-propeller domain-containing protein n=1 Tax=Mortierella hygrophila TaxID=979708 RepID=A0A9P6F8L2_9FUNG|nr:hypothetical protein EC957_012214 [Mortierella hygrophila]